MLVDLDSRDLIPLESDETSLTETLQRLFTSVDARLVLSAPVIDEIIEPLRRETESAVMRLLNRIESIPHTWIRTVDLEDREIEQASRCYLEEREYEPVYPFVDSYLDTAVGLNPAVRSYYRGRSLAGVIWDQVHGERVTPRPVDPTISFYESWVAHNRSFIEQWSNQQYQAELRRAFHQKVANILSTLRPQPRVPVDTFTEHLWDHPCWCPGTRLSFEMIHVFFYDLHTMATTSDLEDFSRVRSLPYVDVFTCDNVKRDYLRRLSTSEKYRLQHCGYWSRCRVSRNLDEVVEVLRAGAQSN